MLKHRGKDGSLWCREGYKVGSRTGLNRCPTCRFRDSKSKYCRMAQVSSKAASDMNKAMSKMMFG